MSRPLRSSVPDPRRPESRRQKQRRPQTAPAQITPVSAPRITLMGVLRHPPVISAMRWTGGLIAFVAGLVVAVMAGRLADTYEPFASMRDELRPDGYTIVMVSTTWLLLGALLQTPPAILRRAGVRDGWLALLVLLAYHAVVAVALIPLAATAPDWSDDTSRGDPGSTYPAFVAFVVFGFSIISLCGGLFLTADPPPAPLSRRARKRRAERLAAQQQPDPELMSPRAQLVTYLWWTLALSWLGGALLLIPLLIVAAASGELDSVFGAGRLILAAGVLLAILVAGVAVGSLWWPALRTAGGGTGRLFATAGAILLGAWLLAQLPRVVPAPVAYAVAVVALLAITAPGLMRGAGGTGQVSEDAR